MTELRPAKFKVDEELTLSGKPVRVAGLVQYEPAADQVITRYQLMGSGGGLVLQEDPSVGLALLRPFPPAAAPEAAGNTVTVMGEKYLLGAVRRLKVLGAAGSPPGGAPKAPLLLSALFEGKMGVLFRELVPGAAAQTYYFVKQLAPNEVLSGEELAKQREGERIAAEVMEQAEEAEAAEKKEKPLAKVAVWIVAILVIGGLVYACSGDDESSSSSSSSSSRYSVRFGSDDGHHGGGK